MNNYELSEGMHTDPSEGRCAMEWVAYIAGEEHSDHPVCVSPFLIRFGMALNDAMPHEQRQGLRPYLARMIGTNGDGLDRERAYLAADWAVRVVAPIALRAAWGHTLADRLASLPPIVDVESSREANNIARSIGCVGRSESLRYSSANCVGHACAAANTAYAFTAANTAYIAYAFAAANTAYIAGRAVDCADSAARACAFAATDAAGSAEKTSDRAADYATAVAYNATEAGVDVWSTVFPVLDKMLPTVSLPIEFQSRAREVCTV